MTADSRFLHCHLQPFTWNGNASASHCHQWATQGVGVASPDCTSGHTLHKTRVCFGIWVQTYASVFPGVVFSCQFLQLTFGEVEIRVNVVEKQQIETWPTIMPSLDFNRMFLRPHGYSTWVLISFKRQLMWAWYFVMLTFAKVCWHRCEIRPSCLWEKVRRQWVGNVTSSKMVTKKYQTRKQMQIMPRV